MEMEFVRKLLDGFAQKNDQKHQIHYKWSHQEHKVAPRPIICSESGVLATFWSKYANQLPGNFIFDFLIEVKSFYLMYGFTFSGNLRRVQRFGPILHPEITISWISL